MRPGARAGLFTLALAAALAVHPTAPAAAQRARPAFARWTPAATARAPAASVPDSVRRVAHYRHWHYAAWAAGVGAVAGLIAGAALPMDCADCDPPSRGTVVLLAGGAGGAAGGILGFLWGLGSPTYETLSPAGSPP